MSGIWRSEGKAVSGVKTSQDLAIAAGMSWTVSKIPSYFMENGVPVQDPNAFKIKRNDLTGADSILGEVGTVYNPIQNVRHFEFFDECVGKGLAEYDSAGFFGNGARTWALAKLPDVMKIGNDIIEKYILISNAHNGTGSIIGCPTNIRVACENSLKAAIRGAQNIIKVRHTANAEASFKEGLRLIGLVNEANQKAEDIFNKMAKTMVSTDILAYFLEYVIPSASGTGNSQRAINVRQTVQSLFEGGAKGADLPEFKGTAWGMYNAVVEYVDYSRNVRGSRLENIWFGSGATIKEDAFSAAAALAEGGKKLTRK